MHLRWTMLRLAEGELPSVTGGVKMRGNDTVPLSLACRTVAKAASKLAIDPDSNEAEVQVRRLDLSRRCSTLDHTISILPPFCLIPVIHRFRRCPPPCVPKKTWLAAGYFGRSSGLRTWALRIMQCISLVVGCLYKVELFMGVIRAVLYW